MTAEKIGCEGEASPMGVNDLISQLSAIRDRSSQPQSVLVVLQGQGNLGPTPGVALASVACGFDWDQGRVLLHTARPVIDLTAEQVKDIQASVRKGGSWHAYQAYQRQAAKIADLERRLEIGSRAAAIADKAMLEILQSEGVPLAEHEAAYGLTGEDYEEVDSLAGASSDLRQAVEWLRERGHVEIVSGPGGHQRVIVLDRNQPPLNAKEVQA